MSGLDFIKNLGNIWDTKKGTEYSGPEILPRVRDESDPNFKNELFVYAGKDEGGTDYAILTDGISTDGVVDIKYGGYAMEGNALPEGLKAGDWFSASGKIGGQLSTVIQVDSAQARSELPSVKPKNLPKIDVLSDPLGLPPEEMHI